MTIDALGGNDSIANTNLNISISGGAGDDIVYTVGNGSITLKDARDKPFPIIIGESGTSGNEGNTSAASGGRSASGSSGSSRVSGQGSGGSVGNTFRRNSHSTTENASTATTNAIP